MSVRLTGADQPDRSVWGQSGVGVGRRSDDEAIGLRLDSAGSTVGATVGATTGPASVYGGESELVVLVRLCGIDPATIAAAECSVLWRTEGKGDEDMGIHHFVRRGRGYFCQPPSTHCIGSDPRELHDRIECRLPPTPLSYRGHLITICWCVRWRVCRDEADDLVTEVPFDLVAAGR